MKKIIGLLLLSFGLHGQTLIKLKQIENAALGSVITTTGTGVPTWTNVLPASAIPTTAIYQPSLNGTGFVKATGTVISYDNSTYLTTSSASAVYVLYSGSTTSLNAGANSYSNTAAIYSNTLSIANTASVLGIAYYQTTVNIGPGSYSYNPGALLSVVNATGNAIFGVTTRTANGYSQIFLGANTATSSTGFFHSGSAVTPSGLYLANSFWLQSYSESMLFNNANPGNIVFATGGTAAGNEAVRIYSTQNVSISGAASSKILTPNAILHLAAGTSALPAFAMTAQTAVTSPTNGNIYYVTTSGFNLIGNVTTPSAVTTPSLYGSSAASGSLLIQSTSDATKGLIQIGSTGSINIGSGTFPTSALVGMRFGKGTGMIDFGEYTSGRGTIWLTQSSWTTANWSLSNTTNTTYVNGTNAVAMLQGGSVITMQGGASGYNTVPYLFGTNAFPVATALVELRSTTQGFLPPRMTTTQRDAISSPAAGLIIYNTTTNKINVYTTAWEAVTSL